MLSPSNESCNMLREKVEIPCVLPWIEFLVRGFSDGGTVVEVEFCICLLGYCFREVELILIFSGINASSRS